MSPGADGLILQALLGKLRQLARAAPPDILTLSSTDILNSIRLPGSAMAPATLTSLRSFAAVTSGAPPPGPATVSQTRTTFNHAAPAFTPASRLTFSTAPASSFSLWNTGRASHLLASAAGGSGASARGHRRNLATAAEDVAHAQDNVDKVHPGRLVEFKAGNNYNLGLVLRPSVKSASLWDIEDESGAVRSVHERDVAYVLPGGTFSSAKLAVISKEASEKEDESLKEALMSISWELSQPGALYTVPEMAELLFTAPNPASCAAAHRLLLNDRLYFKQVGRHPPMYAARSEGDVKSLRRAAELAKEAEELQAKFLGDVAAARALPRKQRPTQKEWREGPHGTRLRGLEAFALGQTLPEGDAGRAQAVAVLAAAGVQRTPQGAAELLQAMGYWTPHAQLGLLSSGLTEEFTPELEATAAALAAVPPPDPDASTRQDLTHLHVVTIDDESTTEIDDGLSAEIVPGSNGDLIRIWVHVADPSRWVAPDDPLDLEARRRAKTLYLPTGMIPMFPLSLATGPFSLRQGLNCCALTVSCLIDRDGVVVPGSGAVTPSSIIPTVRLTYDLADEMLGECSPEEEPGLHALAAAAAARKRYRTASGAVEIAMPESKVEVADAHVEVPDVTMEASKMDDSVSRQLVAEMMILAGEVCARLGSHMSVPLPYRGQADPVLPTEEELAAVPPGPCRMLLLRSVMTRSITAADTPQRHAGLGLDAYAQITSPIRRYGDLLAHWQLKAALRGDPPPFSTRELTEVLGEVGNTTQRVSKLERDAQSYWIAYYFKGAIMKDPNASWEAMFMGWFKQEAGLARVLLEGLGLECLVKVARPARPGTRFRVRCVSADPLMGMYRLDEVMGGTYNSNSGTTSSENGAESGTTGVAMEMAAY